MGLLIAQRHSTSNGLKNYSADWYGPLVVTSILIATKAQNNLDTTHYETLILYAPARVGL